MKQVLRYLRKYTILLVLSIVCAGVTVVSQLMIPIFTGDAVDLILGKGNVDFTEIKKILIYMAIAIAITAVSQWVMNLLNNCVTCRVVHDMRRDAFNKLNKLPLSYLDRKSYGEIVSRMITDVDQFSEGLLMGLTQFFTGIITIVMTLIFMFMLNPLITGLVVVLTPVSLVVAAIIAKKSFHLFQKQSKLRGEQTGFIDEMIGNKKVLQAFHQEDEMIKRFEVQNEEYRKASLQAIFASSTTNPSTRFVNGLIYAAVGMFGGFLAINGTITVGELSCFLSYANQYTKPFNEISGVVTEMQNALACAKRVFEIIYAEPEKEDAENAVALSEVSGKVELRDVSFSYVPEQRLIEHLNLLVKPGQKIAIVGPTGCGKTTLINLLMRFYDTTGGNIYIEENEIKDIKRESLREAFGMVLQDTWIKAGTIRDNILMGNPSATEEEMIEAAKASHAHSFIRRLPNGYDTVINEDGGNLSQGQKQLLCIARVMLCKPRMLILDEATSSIDTRTEIKIQSAFSRLMEGRTSFIVAHRLTTIQDADCILVMKDGNVVEQGTHDELIGRGGFYSTLYTSNV